jgi:drug/metabolite transporter (DMT)-like permease
MKNAGIIIIVIGLAITLFAGFTYFTREKIVDIGELEITANKRHTMNWSPLVGVGIMVAGVVVYMVGTKK